MPIKVESVKTELFEIKYFKFGTGKKTAVILPGLSVKSVMNSCNGIASAYKALHNDYTTYVFDRRTFCPEGYSLLNMAEDTAAAMDHLGIKDACVFGASQGGMIAQYIALIRPDLVGRLAVCSTVARITESNSRVIENWLKYAEQKNETMLNRSICETVYSDEFNERFGELILQMMGGVTEDDFRRFIILAKGCRGFDITDKLGNIKCPFFVSGSKKDKVFDIDEIILPAEKTNAQLCVYDGYSHAVYDEAPDFLFRLKRFFDSGSS